MIIILASSDRSDSGGDNDRDKDPTRSLDEGLLRLALGQFSAPIGA